MRRTDDHDLANDVRITFHPNVCYSPVKKTDITPSKKQPPGISIYIVLLLNTTGTWYYGPAGPGQLAAGERVPSSWAATS
jgi:hypothetical protein